MILILSGRAGSGKNTLANFLQKHLKEDYHQVAYATYLKKLCKEQFGLTNDQVYDQKLKEVPDERYPKEDGSFWTPREIMQHMGTEAFRAIDNLFWIKKMFSFVDRHKLKNIIITDARFEDEIEFAKERGGIHIRLETDRDVLVHGSNHSSETSLDDYSADYIVQNTGTLDDLEDMAKRIIKEIEPNGNKAKVKTV